VALKLGPIRFPWQEKDFHANDPYWDFFINTPPADLANTVTEMIRNAPEGNVFPTKAELHTPEITSTHLKGMAHYFGADLVGVARLDSMEKIEGYPFGVVCALRAQYDPRQSPGIGGQVPVQKGLFVTFVLSAWIRELGFRATAARNLDSQRLASQAGLGQLNSKGRLVTGEFGDGIYVADVILTDLPLAVDG